jgi:transcriptional regulator with XRE-family HTH domain
MLKSTPTSSISASLVSYLRDQGQTLREIGEMIGLSESFISRVAKGERSFTLDHLSAFEQALGEPLPALLLQSTRPDDLPAKQQAAFDDALQLLRDLGDFRKSLAPSEEPSNAKSAAKGHVRLSKKSRAAG